MEKIINYVNNNKENLIYVMVALLILLVALFIVKSVEAECHSNYKEYINRSCLCYYESGKPDIPEYKIPVEVVINDNQS